VTPRQLCEKIETAICTSLTAKRTRFQYHLNSIKILNDPILQPFFNFLFCKWCIYPSAFRWFLDAISYPRTSISFVVNGYLMGASFFLCRILIMPVYYYKCYSVWGTDEQRNLGFLVNFYWIFTCIVLDAINLYWFAKIVKGALKLTRKLKNHYE